MEISRTGMRLTTPLAIEVGQSVSGKLTYRGDAVEVTGAVRWRREAGADSDDRSQLPFWEIGVAFTRVGKTDPEGIWRRLEVHERGAPPS